MLIDVDWVMASLGGSERYHYKIYTQRRPFHNTSKKRSATDKRVQPAECLPGKKAIKKAITQGSPIGNASNCRTLDKGERKHFNFPPNNGMHHGLFSKKERGLTIRQ
jgi:hypothetical protein